MTLTTGDWNVPPPTLLGQGVPRVTTELPSLSGDAPLRLLRTMMVWIGSVRRVTSELLRLLGASQVP